MLPYIPNNPIFHKDILINNNKLIIGRYDSEMGLFEGLYSEVDHFDEIIIISYPTKNERNIKILNSSLNSKLEYSEQITIVDFYESTMDCFMNKNLPSDKKIIASFHSDDVEFI